MCALKCGHIKTQRDGSYVKAFREALKETNLILDVSRIMRKENIFCLIFTAVFYVHQKN